MHKYSAMPFLIGGDVWLLNMLFFSSIIIIAPYLMCIECWLWGLALYHMYYLIQSSKYLCTGFCCYPHYTDEETGIATVNTLIRPSIYSGANTQTPSAALPPVICPETSQGQILHEIMGFPGNTYPSSQSLGLDLPKVHSEVLFFNSQIPLQKVIL